jgi:streptomycin 6-kinase
LDVSRARGWGFAQAVLSAIWSIEDGRIAEADAALTLARALLQSKALRADFMD